MKLPAWLGNRYSITLICFVAWMVFFDRDDIPTQWARHRQLEEIKRSRDYYREQTVLARHELDSMKTDPAVLEKIAREKYLMKKDAEELFVITKDK